MNDEASAEPPITAQMIPLITGMITAARLSLMKLDHRGERQIAVSYNAAFWAATGQVIAPELRLVSRLRAPKLPELVPSVYAEQPIRVLPGGVVPRRPPMSVRRGECRTRASELYSNADDKPRHLATLGDTQ